MEYAVPISMDETGVENSQTSLSIMCVLVFVQVEFTNPTARFVKTKFLSKSMKY